MVVDPLQVTHTDIVSFFFVYVYFTTHRFKPLDIFMDIGVGARGWEAGCVVPTPFLGINQN